METDEFYMKKCIELAKNGRGKTSPNPLVGCVVLDCKGNEISTGFHGKYGENHAERNALLNLSDEAKGGTLYVNLEPCSHFGKTPPCADLIIQKEIKKVVIAMKDVNPIVAGNGIKKLEDAGIEVIQGVLQEEAEEINEIFIKNMTKQQTFVAIKTATTIDGKIATANGSSKWITSPPARSEGRRIRSYHDAIMTTASTVLADNPEMKHKTKIIIDRNLKTDFSQKIYQDGKIYIAVNPNTALKTAPKNVEFIKYTGLQELFAKLYQLKITSVIVEAGGKFNGSLLRENLVDKIYHFIAPKILCDNAGRSCFDGAQISDISNSKNFQIKSVTNFAPDILVVYK